MFCRSLNLRFEIRSINSSTTPDKHKVKMRPTQFAIEPSFLLTCCNFLCNAVDIVNDRLDVHGFYLAVFHHNIAIDD